MLIIKIDEGVRLKVYKEGARYVETFVEGIGWVLDAKIEADSALVGEWLNNRIG